MQQSETVSSLKRPAKRYLPIVFSLIIAAAVIPALIAADRDPADDGNVVINEVCTSNVTCVKDDNGDYPDWIELYNPTDHAIDLSGYTVYKSSDPEKGKFVIPAGTQIDPGTYYVCDPGFALSSDGCIITLADGKGKYTDRVVVPKLKYDTVYARISDGDPRWEIKEPTCGWENSGGKSLYQIVDGTVYASAGSGFYGGEFDLKLQSSAAGRSIYYTTDGSDPVTNGILYDGSIRIYDRSGEDNVYSVIPEVSLEYVNSEVSLPSFPVDKCTVIKAVAKEPQGGYTDTSYYVYFIGYDDRPAYDNMAVVSVTTDPEDLFSYENGIMVLGERYDEYVSAGSPQEYNGYKANFCTRGRRTEVEASVTVFDELHRKVLDTTAGLRLKGLSSRWNIQKSFAVTFHRAVGGKYSESFTLGGNDFELHSFAIDKCGQDTGSKMVDSIAEHCMYYSDCATVRRIPCCLFLDGEYWGFYWLSERFDRSYMADRYGVDKDDVIFIDTDEFERYADWPMEQFDRESLIEYYAANIITAHEGDWPHMNFRIWGTSEDEGTIYGDAKYRPVIYDMNSESMKSPDFNSFEYLLERFPPFETVSDDAGFREELVNKIDEMSMEEFNPDKVLEFIDKTYEQIREQIVLDKMRYTNCSREEAAESFEDSVENLKDFYRTRYEYISMYKEDYLNWK